MVVFLKPRIGFIGAGNVAKHHIEAAVASGFQVELIAARPNSSNLENISRKYGIKKTVYGVENIDTNTIDALSIITNAENLFDVYKHFEDSALPILVEKPMFTTMQQLKKTNFSRPNTLIGFNRRFYNSTIALKKETQKLNSINGIIKIPELSWSQEITSTARKEAVTSNAIHILDLVNYIFGSEDGIDNLTSRTSGNGSFQSSLILFKNKNLVDIQISFGIPDTYSFQVLDKNKRFELSPIEEFRIYDSIKFEEPSTSVNYKRYIPQNNIYVSSFETNSLIKPGFLGMYNKFMELTLKNNSINFPNLKDAKNAFELANKLIEQLEVTD
jgi:predicted dehydrogenase